MTRFRVVLGAALLGLFLSACGGSGDDSASSADTTESSISESDSTDATDAAEVDEAAPEDSVADEAGTAEASAAGEDDGGDFVLQYDDPPTPVQELLDASGEMSPWIDGLNQILKLPKDIGVAFTAQTEEGPAFFPEEDVIVMPDTFADFVVSTLSAAYPDATDEDLAVAYVDIQQFVLIHEMGHALVEILDLPVLGKEEDAVDALAAVLLTELGDRGGEVSLRFAQLFEASGNSSELSQAAFWDEHSLDLQRAYSVVCWVYGSDTDAFADLAEVIPESRRDRCRGEYAQLSKSWAQVLAPHFRD